MPIRRQGEGRAFLWLAQTKAEFGFGWINANQVHWGDPTGLPNLTPRNSDVQRSGVDSRDSLKQALSHKSIHRVAVIAQQATQGPTLSLAGAAQPNVDLIKNTTSFKRRSDRR